jgi:hypothetical protein
MDWSLIPDDGWKFLAALASGLILGTITAATANKNSPAWPLRLYLALFKTSRTLPVLRDYAEKRTSFGFREQLFASAFVWFFIFFGIAIFVFPAR